MPIRVDLEPLGEGIDRALSHPLGQLAARLFPRAVAEVRAARDAMPSLAAQAHDKVASHVRDELDALEDEAIDTVKRGWRRMVKASRKGRRP